MGAALLGGAVSAWLRCVLLLASRAGRFCCCFPCAAGFPGRVRLPFRTALSCDTGTRERSEEHTSELQSQSNLVCRLLLEKKKVPLSAMTVRPLLLTQSSRTHDG